MVGPASALSTYSMTMVKKIVNNDHFNSATATKFGDLAVTFDVPTWQSVGSTASYVYLSLPSSPTGYAFDLNVLATPAQTAGTETNGIPNVPSVTLTSSAYIIGGTGAVTITGADPDSFLDESTNTTVAGWNMLMISLTTSSVAQGATSVELSIPLCVAAPPGETGAIAATASAPSSSVFSSGSITIGTVGTSTVSLSVESTPAISSAGGSLGTIDIKEGANGALYDTNGSPVLELTLPPGFTWNTSGWGTTSPFSYMWGGAWSTNPGTSVAAPGPQTSAYYSLITGPATNSAYTSGLSTSNGGRELDFYNSTLASASGLWFKFTGTISVDEATAQTGNITVTVAGQTSANVTTLVVGSYGSFGNTGAVGTAPTIVAGKAGTTAGEIGDQGSYPRQPHLGPDDHPDPALRCGLGSGSGPRHHSLHQHRKHRVILQ